MTDNYYSDGISKTRPVLGDVTNRIMKRGFSMIPTNSGSKSDDIYSQNFKKRASISNSICSEINSLKGNNNISTISKIQTETKNPISLSCGDTDASRDENENREDAVSSEVAEANYLGMNDDNDVSLDDIEKCGSQDFSRFMESQESRASGLEKCVGLKGDACADLNVGVDLIKSCSCSFCTKAAYIWSDLHYQDIKGRIAALKKSQKEASTLAQRSIRSQGIEQQNPTKTSKVESDLNVQWKSLFLHMEDIFTRESSQLETSLFALKDLRDNCKTELDSTNGTSSAKQ